MTISVDVNPPKTPVTEGSQDVAPATLPNVCKMPGPPAPFVPTPLPNLGRSSDHLTDCTSTVLIEGKKVAIKGSYYMSQLSGDMVSKGSGGGIVSAAEEGKTQFVAPGSMNVKAEGANIQLLGDAMTNNGGSSANSGTLPGNQQPPKTGLPAWQHEFLCDIFCGCLAQWKAYRLKFELGRLSRIAYPELDKYEQASRIERQKCVEKELEDNPMFQAEQPFNMGTTPPSPGTGQFTRIPDVVALAGRGAASGTNITAVVEMKFPDDTYRKGQRRDYRRIAKKNNPNAIFAHIDEKVCKCATRSKPPKT